MTIFQTAVTIVKALLTPGWGQAHVTSPCYHGSRSRAFLRGQGCRERIRSWASTCLRSRIPSPGSRAVAGLINKPGAALAELTGTFSAARQQTNHRPALS